MDKTENKEIFKTKWYLIPVNKKYGRYIGVQARKSTWGDYLLIGKGVLAGEVFNTKEGQKNNCVYLPLKYVKKDELSKAISVVLREFESDYIKKIRSGESD